jgi:enoyl-[acyl-carrier protein] reductase I
MGLLTDKNALIFGVANERSIAWGIARSFNAQGARIGLSYAGDVLEKRVKTLAKEIDCTFVEPCDVSKDDEIRSLTSKAVQEFEKVDILVHAIGFANREELSGPYYRTSRVGFHTAMDISVYSLTALAQAFQPYMNPGGAMLTLTYYGSEKVAPGYNVMGVAKAALESSVRYLAYDLGPQGVRVNAISAGPIRTLAAAGVSRFKDMYRHFTKLAPLQQHVSADDIGEVAVFLCSDMSAKITGEVLYVDSGYNIIGIPEPPECE